MSIKAPLPHCLLVISPFWWSILCHDQRIGSQAGSGGGSTGPSTNRSQGILEPVRFVHGMYKLGGHHHVRTDMIDMMNMLIFSWVFFPGFLRNGSFLVWNLGIFMGYQWKKMNMVFLWLHLQVFLVNLPETEKNYNPWGKWSEDMGILPGPYFWTSQVWFYHPSKQKGTWLRKDSDSITNKCRI